MTYRLTSHTSKNQHSNHPVQTHYMSYVALSNHHHSRSIHVLNIPFSNYLSNSQLPNTLTLPPQTTNPITSQKSSNPHITLQHPINPKLPYTHLTSHPLLLQPPLPYTNWTYHHLFLAPTHQTIIQHTYRYSKSNLKHRLNNPHPPSLSDPLLMDMLYRHAYTCVSQV